jgi:hypothetical protein
MSDWTSTEPRTLTEGSVGCCRWWAERRTDRLGAQESKTPSGKGRNGGPGSPALSSLCRVEGASDLAPPIASRVAYLVRDDADTGGNISAIFLCYSASSSQHFPCKVRCIRAGHATESFSDQAFSCAARLSTIALAPGTTNPPANHIAQDRNPCRYQL